MILIEMEDKVMFDDRELVMGIVMGMKDGSGVVFDEFAILS